MGAYGLTAAAKIMTNMTLLTGVCAWQTCTVEGCSLSRDPESGRLIRLPTCETHRKKFEMVRALYKRFGELADVFKERLEQPLSDLKKLFYLDSLKEAKAQELKARLKQTVSIKRVYTDPQHLFYMKKIEGEIEDVDNAIKALVATNTAGEASSESSDSDSNRDSPTDGMNL